jgi:hypothetical protein
MNPDTIGSDDSSRRMRRVYAGVIAVEAAVLIGIWLFQRYFGA